MEHGPVEWGAAAWFVGWLLAVAVLVTLILGSWPDLVSAWATAEFAGVEGIFTMPVWPIKAIIVAGTAIAGMVLVRELMRTAAAADSRGWPAAAALVIVILAGPRLVRGWLRAVARRRSNELFVLNVLQVASSRSGIVAAVWWPRAPIAASCSSGGDCGASRSTRSFTSSCCFSSPRPRSQAANPPEVSCEDPPIFSPAT